MSVDVSVVAIKLALGWSGHRDVNPEPPSLKSDTVTYTPVANGNTHDLFDTTPKEVVL